MMLVVVVIFLFLSLTTLLNISSPIMKQSSVTDDFLDSRKSYFLAEAGVEDVAYRIIKNKNFSASDSLVLDGGEVSISVTDGVNKKYIEARANNENLLRNVKMILKVGTGSSFSYGIQSGAGGFILSNNSVVNGSVYSNGAIVGSRGSSITGSAISANSSALSADQYNDTPATPTSSIIFGKESSNQDLAQSFILDNVGPLSKASLYIKKVGAPSDLTARIVNDNNGLPSGNTIVSAVLSKDLIATNYAWVDVSFSEYFQLTLGTRYWLVLDGGTSNNKYYVIGANNSYAGGFAKVGQYGGSWSNTNPSNLSSYFKVYLGGVSGLISGIEVGSGGVGDANAYQVTNSTVAGNLYCKIGSGNNKVCNTSKPIPGAQDLPLSDAQIIGWKNEAVSGQIINGNYTLSSSGSLGPAKIVGDLTVRGRKILTMTGTIWVTGKITLEEGSSVVLDRGYGTGSGVLLSDGRMIISNNTIFAGSGQAGSYIIALTTSDCPISESCGGKDAIEVSNNIEAAILSAQNGVIRMKDNANAKQVTAHIVILEENVSINYESGMINANFVNGPSGGWSLDKWAEIQ